MNLFTKSLAEGISTRILAGILTFVGIMMVVGWVAINEGGRMVAFEQRFEARAIERGAGLFANNCSTCHGIDGRGLEDRAPGLNNPQFFGHDFFPEISAELSGLRPAALDLDALPRERDILLGIAAPAEATDAEAAGDDTTAEASGEEPVAADTEAEAASEEAAVAEAQADAANEIEPQSGTTGDSSIGTQPIDAVEGETTEAASETVSDDELSETDAARMAEINVRLDEIAAQYGDGDLAAATSVVTARITELETQRNSQIQTAIDNGYNPDEPDRLGVVGWVSSLDQYIHTTLIHGRPGSENYWDSGQGMAAWGQIGGGPLRDDQLKDLGEYIQNWDRDWTLEDLLAVNQFGIVPLNPAGVVLGEPFVPVGTNINIALAEIAAVSADPQTGLTLYASFGCEACHAGGATAPLTEGTVTRVEQERLPLPEFEGYTVEEYLVESILNPGAFTAPGYASGLMPANFGERLSSEDLAHIVAYLMSQDAE